MHRDYASHPGIDDLLSDLEIDRVVAGVRIDLVPHTDPAHHGCANRPEGNPGVDDRAFSQTSLAKVHRPSVSRFPHSATPEPLRLPGRSLC